MIECKDCVNGLFGACQYSLHNAACLFTAKDWHTEDIDKIEDYAARMREYYEERYKFHLRQIDAVMDKVKREHVVR